jgi:hypothetical protein
MSDDNFNLSWDEFSASATSTFKNLYVNKQFSDVTLVCEDDKVINAHKFILCASSSFFEKILLLNPHKNPMIYLKGIKFKELESIVRFIYLGQTEVRQNDLSDFIEAAKDLQINGLKENVTKELHKEQSESKSCIKSELSPVYDSFSESSEANLQPLDEDKSAVEEYSGELDVIYQDENYQQFSTPHEFVCEDCKKKFSNSQNLKQHRAAVHMGKRFPCNQCDYEGTRSTTLKRHIASRHSML